MATGWTEVLLVGVLELGFMQQLVQADNLLVIQLCRHCVLIHATPHLRYQPSCINQLQMRNQANNNGQVP